MVSVHPRQGSRYCINRNLQNYHRLPQTNSSQCTLPHSWNSTSTYPKGSAVEKHKQETDTRHPLYGAQLPKQRLKSRHSFLKSAVSLSGNPADTRCKLWEKSCPPPTHYLPPSEHLPAGSNLPWSIWKSLNRLRTQVGRCNSNLVKWGYLNQTAAGCGCGAVSQTMLHLLSCPLSPKSCSRSDLCAASDDAVEVAKFWVNKIKKNKI